jgi:uncharacterized membrane protein
MKMNSPVMQTAMTLTALSALALALVHRGRERLLAAGAALLALASFLITRFGNVPINSDIKKWAVSSAPADHAEILRRWDLYNNLRTLTAVVAFALLITLALRRRAARPADAADAPAPPERTPGVPAHS